jgi:hypothetical protein
VRRHGQQPVPGGVAEAVVDRLEVVEVEEHDGDTGRLLARPSRSTGQGVLEAVQEQDPVARPVNGSCSAWCPSRARWATCSQAVATTLASAEAAATS